MSASVQEIRRLGEDAFARHGIPTTRLESWKYTDVRRTVAPFMEAIENPADSTHHPSDSSDPGPIAGLDAYHIRVHDGLVVDCPDALPDGVEIVPLARLLAEDEARAVEPLGFDEQASLFNGFVALNAARARDGAAICIAPGIVVDRPICIRHTGGGQVAHIRHGIHVGEGARATIIEHYVGGSDAPGFTNVVSHLRLSADSVLTHIRLQQESGRQLHVGRVEACQKRGSRFISHSIALGGSLSRIDIVAGLHEPDASCELNGLYLTDGRQHCDHHTVIEHRAPHCCSREQYRGILGGRSRAVFNGRVVVHKGAVKTDSAQGNANLLLSGKAEIDTKPELEIYNDDVKCAHGATVGQLDENQLFYLKSRGLGEEEARQLLTFAFADEVLAGLGEPAVRRHIEQAAFSKLPHGGDIEAMLTGPTASGGTA